MADERTCDMKVTLKRASPSHFLKIHFNLI
jgi:hypothetical protein